jgi:cytochrome c biogenesis protein CcdA
VTSPAACVRWAIVGLLLAASTDGRAQMGPPRAEVTPVVARDGFQSGSVARVALRVLLPEGLHSNSNRPRDPLLIPMALAVSAPEGVTVAEIVYPSPTDLTQAGIELPLSVFERDFAIGVALRLSGNTAPGAIAVPFTLRYQACDETMCYLPVTVESQWTLRVVERGAVTTATHQTLFDRIAFGSGEPPPSADPFPAATLAPPATPAPSTPGDAVAMLGGFSILGSAAGYLGTADFLQFIANAEAGVVERGWFEGRGPLAILLIVLVGGLALNLTPCVLPLVPVNLAIIGAGSQAGSRGRGFLLGAAYGSAMALVYGLLGLVVVLTASTFGAINASPWFNLGIAILFVVLALAMFDLLVIDFSRLSSRFSIRESGHGTFLVAFGMGAVAALLAGACVAPVVIQVVLFASHLYAGGTAAALALPFLLGVGMALPWPIAGAGLAALPPPGAWMVRVKQVFGVFILGTAIYYGYVAYGLFENRWVNAADVEASVAQKLKEGWHADLASGLLLAKQEQKPVLIDLWATWCKNCLTMDKTTLQDPSVTAALENYVKIKFQAEDMDAEPARSVLRHFNAVGLPTYVIVKPAAQ